MTTPTTSSASDALQKAREIEERLHETENGTRYSNVVQYMIVAFPSIHAELEKVTAERDAARKALYDVEKSLNRIRNLAYSGDDYILMNIAKNGLKKIRRLLTSFPEIK